MDESVAPRDATVEELASAESSYALIDATRDWANPPISFPRGSTWSARRACGSDWSSHS